MIFQRYGVVEKRNKGELGILRKGKLLFKIELGGKK